MKDPIQNTKYDGPYDLIYVDEYKGEKSIEFINELCKLFRILKINY